MLERVVGVAQTYLNKHVLVTTSPERRPAVACHRWDMQMPRRWPGGSLSPVGAHGAAVRWLRLQQISFIRGCTSASRAGGLWQQFAVFASGAFLQGLPRVFPPTGSERLVGPARAEIEHNLRSAKQLCRRVVRIGPTCPSCYARKCVAEPAPAVIMDHSAFSSNAAGEVCPFFPCTAIVFLEQLGVFHGRRSATSRCQVRVAPHAQGCFMIPILTL